MTQPNITEALPAIAETWQAANRDQIEAEQSRLRFLVRRRILWLRQIWKRDPLQNFREWVISDADADLALGGSRRAQERNFYEHDPEAVALTGEIAVEMERAQDAAKRALSAGGPSAIEILVRLFHLDAFEREVLLMCLVPELDPAFDRLFAYMQDDATQRFPTPHLAFDLFGRDVVDGLAGSDEPEWKHFMPEAPLFHSRLIRRDTQGEAARGREGLRLEPRVRDYLLGLNRPDEQAALVLRPVEVSGIYISRPMAALGPLEQKLRSWNGRGRMPAINLHGRAPAESRGAAAALCARLGVGLFEIALSNLPTGPLERRELLYVLEREAALLPAAFFLDLTQIDEGDRATSASVSEWVHDLRAFLLIASNEPWRSKRPPLSVEISQPSASEQREAWREALRTEWASDPEAAEAAGHFLDSLVQQFDFTFAQIQMAADAARGAAQLHDSADAQATASDVWRAARAQSTIPMDGLAQRVQSAFTFADLVLPDDVLEQLREIAAQVSRRSQVYDHWGFGARLTRGRGIAALFAGPSGTGKTMAAEVLSNTLNLDLYRVDLSGVVSKYIGETEKNLRRVFDSAEQSGAILFFDEADALFGKRSEVRDSHDRYANIEINYLLQRMEDYRGLAILATNMKSSLDQAFLRRLRFLVDFPFPTAAERMRIWQGVFPPSAETRDLDFAFLGRLEITGGSIKNIAINAAFLAADKGRPIGMQDILAAARREYTKIDKLILETEFGRYFRAVRR